MSELEKKQEFTRNIIIDSDDEGVRLDRWFSRHYPSLSHSYLQKMLRKGQIRLNGKRAKNNDRLVAGESIKIPSLSDISVDKVQSKYRAISNKELKVAEEIQKQLIYKDDRILVINKPPGLAVQGGKKVSIHLDRLLGLLKYDSQHRPKLVHRLDKDTSGILVLARKPNVAADLAQAFQRKEIRKVYWALVVGVPVPAEGRMEAPLKKLLAPGGEKTLVSNSGKSATTLFRTIENSGRRVSFLVLQPETGRTHQLRAHCSQVLGCPILGDGKYGGTDAHPGINGISRQVHLHARSITLPKSFSNNGKTQFFIEAPLPKHIQVARSVFGFEQKPDKDPFSSVRNL